MKRNHMGIVLLSFLLLCSLLFGCTASGTANLMDGIIPVQRQSTPEPQTDGAMDFAVGLLQASYADGKNTLLSPLSVFSALAMTSNGAKGETLAQMDAVLGGTAASRNAFYQAEIGKFAGDGVLRSANSIWFKNDPLLTVNRDFLQVNADYYGAGAYQAPFDSSTRNDINRWVKEHTAGRIPKILDDISQDAVMYLINALAFDGEWETPYSKTDVRSGTFTAFSGEKREVEFLHGDESRYLQDGKATGFIKPYRGGAYVFAALLPDEGVSMSDYIASLTGDGLRRTIASAAQESVITALPKFETEYDAELSDVLSAMGMPLAFDPDQADFSGLGTYPDYNICINRVLHKTFLAVDEAGTKAGAATVVEMIKATSSIAEPKRVVLDRPFVYLILDAETNVPIFIGVLADTNK